jgi:cyclase
MPSTRRTFLGQSAAAAALAFAPSAALRAWQQAPAGAPPAAPVSPVFTPIRRNVGFFTGRGGTIGYLISPGGVAIVDTQFPDTAALCLAGVNERSNKRPVDVLLNTHHHGDHTGGNIAFKGVTKRVVAHATAAAHMKQPPGRAAQTAENLYPTETFTDAWNVTLGDEVIRARYYGAAHTGGDAVITFERANVAHMGDLMFNGRHPVIDRPAGASLKNWMTVLDKAAADHTADTIFIFGHGGTNMPVTGNRAELGKMRDYLGALLAYVQSEMKAGKTREQIAAGTTTLKGFEGHGPLNAAVQTAAFDELTGA